MDKDPKRKRRKRKRSGGRFDPERHTGKHTVRSRMEDVGYFFQDQMHEVQSLLRHCKQILKDVKNELLSRLRK